jgi:hypothetical protein
MLSVNAINFPETIKTAVFEVLTAVQPKIQVFLDVTLCQTVKSYRRFEGRAYYVP